MSIDIVVHNASNKPPGGDRLTYSLVDNISVANLMRELSAAFDPILEEPPMTVFVRALRNYQERKDEVAARWVNYD